ECPAEVRISFPSSCLLLLPIRRKRVEGQGVQWPHPAVCPATTFHENGVISFVIPSEAEGSAVPRTFPGNAEYYAQTELSSRPERTRISCHAALETTACAAFSRESRMNFANATNTNRKSGVAEWRDLRFFYYWATTCSRRSSCR